MVTPQRPESSRSGQCQQMKQGAPTPGEIIGKTPITQVSNSAESKKGMQTRSRGASAGPGAPQQPKDTKQDSDLILQDYK